MSVDHACFVCGEPADAPGHIVLPGFELRTCWGHAAPIGPLAKAIEAHVQERLARDRASLVARCIDACEGVMRSCDVRGHGGTAESLRQQGAMLCIDAIRKAEGAPVAPANLHATVEGMRARAEASLRADGVEDVEGSAICLVYDLVSGTWLGFLGDTDATNVHTEGEASASPEGAIASLDAALKQEVPDVD